VLVDDLCSSCSIEASTATVVLMPIPRPEEFGGDFSPVAAENILVETDEVMLSSVADPVIGGRVDFLLGNGGLRVLGGNCGVASGSIGGLTAGRACGAAGVIELGVLGAAGRENDPLGVDNGSCCCRKTPSAVGAAGGVKMGVVAFGGDGF
jgi:hypothetical protein